METEILEIHNEIEELKTSENISSSEEEEEEEVDSDILKQEEEGVLPFVDNEVEDNEDSTFLMLEQIIKAEKLGLLNEIKEECPCPVT